MTKIANPGFTKKFDSCADMLAVAGPKVNFSTLAVGDCFISRDYFPRTGAVYFKMQKTGAASADVTVVFDKLKALPYSGGVDIPADMVVTACSPDFGNKMKQTTDKQIADVVRETTLDLIVARDAKIEPAKAAYQAHVAEARKLYPPYDAAGNILFKAEFDASLSSARAVYESILTAAKAEFEQLSLERESPVLDKIKRMTA